MPFHVLSSVFEISTTLVSSGHDGDVICNVFKNLLVVVAVVDDDIITGFTCLPTTYFKFITKCDSFFYYKVRWSDITKCDRYYKV